MGCKFWIWDIPEVFAPTQTAAGTPAERDSAWWGRGNVSHLILPPNRGVQCPRPPVSCLGRIPHLLVSGEFVEIKPLHCESPHLVATLWLDIWEKDHGESGSAKFIFLFLETYFHQSYLFFIY